MCARLDGADVAGWRAEREGELVRAPGEEGPQVPLYLESPEAKYIPTYLPSA